MPSKIQNCIRLSNCTKITVASQARWNLFVRNSGNLWPRNEIDSKIRTIFGGIHDALPYGRGHNSGYFRRQYLELLLSSRHVTRISRFTMFWLCHLCTANLWPPEDDIGVVTKTLLQVLTSKRSEKFPDLFQSGRNRLLLDVRIHDSHGQV